MSQEPCALSKRDCKPCQSDVPPLKGENLQILHDQLNNNWQVVNEHHLEKEYSFKNFVDALAITNKVGALAEEVFHHPDIFLTGGRVKISIWTHKINGLHEADFILAAKLDNLP